MSEQRCVICGSVVGRYTNTAGYTVTRCLNQQCKKEVRERDVEAEKEAAKERAAFEEVIEVR